MAKKTLLQLAQQASTLCKADPLTDILSDDFGITFTEIVEIVYEQMTVKYDIAAHWELTELDALSDLTKPNYMAIPSGTKDVSWIKYNIQTAADAGRNIWKNIPYCSPEEFIDRTESRDNTKAEVIVVEDFDGGDLHIYNDRAPSYWTTFEDNYVIFDSYNSAEDTTLQATKSQVYALREPVFVQDNAHILNLPDNLFPILLADAVELYYGTYLEDEVPSQVRKHLMNVRLHSRKQNSLTPTQPRNSPYGRR